MCGEGERGCRDPAMRGEVRDRLEEVRLAPEVEALTEDRLEIEITLGPTGDERTLRITGVGARWAGEF